MYGTLPPNFRIAAFSLIALLFTLRLGAQETRIDPADDPDLRLPGSEITATPGGMPSIGIRSVAAQEQEVRWTHGLTFDPILLYRSINLAYDRALTKFVVLGGRVILPVGIKTLDNSNSSFGGVGFELRIFPYNSAPKSVFLRFAPTYYTGSYDVSQGSTNMETRDFSLGSFAIDLGWRWMMSKKMSFDLMIGGEAFSRGIDSLVADIPFVATRMVTDQVLQLHGAVRFGYAW